MFPSRPPLFRPIARLGSAAQSALEVARFGGLHTGDTPAPFEIAARERVYRLRHYFPDNPAPGPPVLLVPPLMLAADVYDISPHSSGVRSLHRRDVDPWVVDFGAPEREEGGFERTLELDAAALKRGLSHLPNGQWPDAVHVVRRIPVTTWYRPSAVTLCRRGFPEPGPRVWFRHGDNYRHD